MSASPAAHPNSNEALGRYQTAQTLVQGVLSRRLVLNDTVFPHWIKGSQCFWYPRETRAGHHYRLVDAGQGSNQAAFDHSALAEQLAQALGQPAIDPDNLPIAVNAIQLDPLNVHFSAANKNWQFDGRLLSEVEPEPAEEAGVLSPNGQTLAIVREHNLWLRDQASGEERALTTDGTAEQPYATTAACSASVGQVQLRWSADSRHVLTYQLDQRGVQTMPLIQHVPADGSLRPQLTEQRLALPGDEHIEHYQLLAIDTQTGQCCRADYAPLPITRMAAGFFTADGLGWWGQDHQAYFIDISRGSQTLRLVAFDTRSGASRVLLEESAPRGIKLSHGIFERPLFYPLPETNELIWMSERSGWAQLYLYDLATGDLKQAITEGEWLVRDILHVDAAKREILVQTAGRDSRISPYYRDICRLTIDSGELVPLMEGDYEHIVLEADSLLVGICQQIGFSHGEVHGVSPDGNYLLATRSRVDTAPETWLVHRNGQQQLIETADISALPVNWHWPEPFSVKAADGETDLYGVIYRPPGFSPEQRYPVLDYSSVHPTYSYVPHAAFTCGAFCGDSYLMGAAYAALGFIVVAMETPGMPYRHKSYQDNWGNSFGFADRVGGLQQLAQRYPAMDLERVGLVSCDGNTSSVEGLLNYPDFYQLGIAVEPEDFRLEAVSQAELFADITPTEEKVAALKGKLLLIHGMLDTFTPVATTLRLTEALRKANKDFDQVLLANDGHEVSSYALRRSWDYLLEHLQGEQPPKCFALKTSWDLLFDSDHS